MLDQLDALRALHETGTTARAAIRLRITQSAVSKRILALEQSCGQPLTQPRGRNIELTPYGKELLHEASPLLAQLKELLQPRTQLVRPLILGSTESLLAGRLTPFLKNCPIQLDLHVHRGPWLVERVRSGQLEAAICVEPTQHSDLIQEPLFQEPMVRIGDPQHPKELWGIEASSLTGAWLARIHADTQLTRRLESFVVLAQLAQSGFCDALVPEGIATAILREPTPYTQLPLLRPIVLICRKHTYLRPEVQRLLASRV